MTHLSLAINAILTAFFHLLAGLFEDSHMRYASESEEGDDPSLASMTEKAIKMLQKEEKGFFLAVEGNLMAHIYETGSI